MKRFVSGSLALLSLVCFLWAMEPHASALTGYVDPGSGLLALQCLTSVFATFGFVFRKKITALFGKKDKPVAKGESLGDA